MSLAIAIALPAVSTLPARADPQAVGAKPGGLTAPVAGVTMEEVANLKKQVIGGIAIPDSLVEHFRRTGVPLRKAFRDTGYVEWILDSDDVGPRCEVVTSFLRFPAGASRDAMATYLTWISLPSVLNERAGVAMFHPYARGRTSDADSCVSWPAKSGAISTKFIEAFRSYSWPAS